MIKHKKGQRLIESKLVQFILIMLFVAAIIVLYLAAKDAASSNIKSLFDKF